MSGQSNKSTSILASVVSLFTLFACTDDTQTPTITPSTSTATISNIRVERAEAVKSPGQTEDFPLPNCGGTGELAQSLGTQFTVQKSVTIGTKATASTGAEVEIPMVVNLELKVQVELTYQETYQTASSRLDTIAMKAAPGTHVVYVIQWEEQKFVSSISYTMKGETYKAPYTYALRIPKISDSHQVGCSPTPPTATPTFIGDFLGEWIAVVGGGFQSLEDAQAYAQRFTSAGYAARVVYRNNDIRVVLVGFVTETEARLELDEVQKISAQAYIRNLSDWCPGRVYRDEYIEC